MVNHSIQTVSELREKLQEESVKIGDTITSNPPKQTDWQIWKVVEGENGVKDKELIDDYYMQEQREYEEQMKN